LGRGPRERGARGQLEPGVQRLEGLHPVLEALRAGRRRVHRLWVRPGFSHPELPALQEAARRAQLTLGSGALPGEADAEAAARAVVLEAGALPELELSQLLEEGKSPRTLLALDGVEDPQNLGAIARVAEAAGAAGLVLTRRRAPPLSPAVARASAGAIEWLPAARVPNLPRALRELKEAGFWVFGADPAAGEDLFQLPDRTLRGDRVLVLGAEGRGLRPAVLGELDHRVRIPLEGRVSSLNVSAAAAVILFEWNRRQALANSP
jgi:23S rRNA (guanosine2251-2'-O)-methyltransferase